MPFSPNPKKPFYKRAWFLVIAGLILISFFASMLDSSKSNSSEKSHSATDSTTSTTTIPEKTWKENLKADVLAADLVMTTCSRLKKVIGSQTKLIASRIKATEKPYKDEYDSAEYIQKITWKTTIHTDTIFRLKRGVTDPALTTSSATIPLESQYIGFEGDSEIVCGLAQDSKALDVSALKLDKRVREMILAANNLPWYPKGFVEQFPGISFKVSKKELDCYSCVGLVYEVVTNKSCPNSLYVEANHYDQNDVIDDWTNDTVSALQAGQIAYVKLYFYTSSRGAMKITKANCY